MKERIVGVLVVLLALTGMVGVGDGRALVSPGVDVEEIRPPRLERPLRAPIPPDVLRLPIQDPYARFLVRVNVDGTVADFVCVEASRPELLAGGAAAVERARFRAATQDGVPIVADTAATVLFVSPTGTLSIVHMGMVHPDAFMYEMNPELRDLPLYTVSAPGELDHPLEVIERVDQYVPVNETGGRVYGRAVVSGYVEHEGRMRMVRLHRTSGLEPVDAAAMRSLPGWRFTPPKRDGKPTAVRIRVPFVYMDRETR